MEGHTNKIRTRYGVFSIDEQVDKKMASALRASEYPIEGLMTIVRAFVDSKSIVVDIGAHVGTFAIPVAQKVQKVIAFEPSAEAFPLLVHNAELNGVSLQALNVALGSEKGTGTLLVRNTSNAGANTLVAGGDIPVTTLDSEVAHVDFIKIDVEGMELEVLKGGAKLIARARPVVLFEVNLSQLRAHGALPCSLEQFFTKHGYQLHFPLEEGSLAFARVRSATLLTALIAPRAWLFFGESAPFDLVAVPKERVLPVPVRGFSTAITCVVSNNLALKYKRLISFFRA